MESEIELTNRSSSSKTSSIPIIFLLLSSTPITITPPAVLAKATTALIIGNRLFVLSLNSNV